MIPQSLHDHLRKDGKMKKRILSIVLVTLLLVSAFAMGGCSKKAEYTELTLYEGDYSEVTLAHYLVKYLVEDHTDLTVNVNDQMSLTNQFKEATADDPGCDILLNYDGTLLSQWLQKDVSDVPEGTSLFDYVKEGIQEEFGAVLLGKVGLNNTYAIAVLPETAEAYGLTTVSDLVPVSSELTFGAESNFFAEDFTDRYWSFIEAYGLDFADYSSIDINLKYTAIANGNFDVTEVYTTDGLNRKYNLVILTDDLNFFPEYNGVYVTRAGLFEDYAETAPNLEEVLDMLTGAISSDDMVGMTYAVDVEEQSPATVAHDFLLEKGLISE